MTRVLVAGASGFVGRAALPHLAARGYEVHAIGRTPVAGPGIVFHEADLFDPAAVARAVAAARASHLLHLAWSVPPGRFWTAPENLDWVAASLVLVRRFVEAGGRRALVAGTCAEYEWGGEAPLREGVTPYRPATLYGAAKAGLRDLLAAYAAGGDLSFAWAHLFFLYGPGEAPGRLVSGAIRALGAGEAFPTSPGTQRRDFMHVDDVGAALAAILASPVDGPVNVGTGTAPAIREILDGIGRLTGRPDLLAFGARALPAGEPAVIAAHPGRLRDEVGFAPRHDLAGGLADTIARGAV